MRLSFINIIFIYSIPYTHHLFHSLISSDYNLTSGSFGCGLYFTAFRKSEAWRSGLVIYNCWLGGLLDFLNFNSNKLVVMGSFRSQPDLVKHSISKAGIANISYAISYMCGTYPLIQVGESTWKTHTSTSHLWPTPKTPYWEFSMATEVNMIQFRGIGIYLRLTALHCSAVG